MAKRRRTPPRAHTSPRRSGVTKSKVVRTAPAREARRIRPAAPPSGLAPGMPAVNAYLAVANVGATIDFLQRAFGFARGVTLADTDGQLRYAEMRHGDSAVMLVRHADPATPTGGTAALYAYVQDVDDALMRARDAGAGVSDAEDRAWGDRAATVVDPDGYRWVLATFKKLAPFS